MVYSAIFLVFDNSVKIQMELGLVNILPYFLFFYENVNFESRMFE
jgi:hypothetical protein